MAFWYAGASKASIPDQPGSLVSMPAGPLKFKLIRFAVKAQSLADNFSKAYRDAQRLCVISRHEK